LHSQIGADDKTGPAAHKKLIKRIGDYKLSWSGDLPAILAADWTFKNPPSAAARPSSDAPTVNVFALTKKVIGDRMVMKQAELTVTTLIVLNTHVYDRFARIPQLGAVAPTSGYGKTTLLKEVLQHLVPRKWYSFTGMVGYVQGEARETSQRWSKKNAKSGSEQTASHRLQVHHQRRGGRCVQTADHE
jgi:hypothetical protein